MNSHHATFAIYRGREEIKKAVQGAAAGTLVGVGTPDPFRNWWTGYSIIKRNKHLSQSKFGNN